uniref:FAD/NAD(P)-binding domain-containing protein n=1 Tax=Mycena chlorophos TaxID=658473 RepID=A0ABQ0LH48_MYCCL|nr:FAD/NAD(P)-binding domain-containing protein [Mycena chlorophos]
MSDGNHSTVFDSAVDPRFGRADSLITGRGLGGSSRINGGQYTVGAAGEFNAWAAAGREGWAYEEMKPFLEKSQTWNGVAPREWHGRQGPIQVRTFEGYQIPVSQQAAEAMARLGFPSIDDMHSPLDPGIGWNKMQFALNPDGTRSSAFRAYLPRSFLQSPSRRLDICTNAIVGRVVLDGRETKRLRAAAVEIHSVDGRHVRIVKAKCEIILAAGALQTPKILLLSGIGPREDLEKLGLEVLHDLPGVGGYLQDHAYVTTTYHCPLAHSMWSMFRHPWVLLGQLVHYMRYGTGWLLCTIVEAEVFFKSSLIRADGTVDTEATAQHLDAADPQNLADFGVMSCGLAEPNGDRSKGFFGLNCVVMSAKSHGRVSLLSRDPMRNPHCQFNYLSAPEDRVALRAALRVSISIAQEMQARAYPLEALKAPNAKDDETVDAFIDAHVETMFHYTSTCRMAPVDDSTAPGVVDDELRVHGVSNLRVADASLFPTVPATHPQALVYAIAENSNPYYSQCLPGTASTTTTTTISSTTTTSKSSSSSSKSSSSTSSTTTSSSPPGSTGVIGTDFENLDTSTWGVIVSGGSSDSATIDTTKAHSGTHSLKVVSIGGYNDHVFFGLSNLTMLGSGADIYGRYYANFQNAFTQDHTTHMMMTDPVAQTLRMGGQFGVLDWNRASDDSIMPAGDPTTDAGSIPIAANTWYCIEFHLSRTTGQIETWANGAVVPSLTTPQTRWGSSYIPNPENWGLGWESYGSDPNTVWYDDIALGTSRLGC